jgi:hypothetical protein
MTTAVSIWLVLILGATASLKAWRSDQAAAALATYGVRSDRGQRLTVWALISAELALAGALAAGAPWAAGATAGLFLAFAVVTLAALLAGRGGRPCACFGSASRLGWSSPIRAAALALVAGTMALGWLPTAPSGYDRWLTVGLSVSVAAVGALALAMFALAREIGVLRLSISVSRGALEIREEGPELGAVQGWAAALGQSTSALLGLAIFTSEGCSLCRQLEPALRYVAADPLLAVQIFDEVADAATWTEAGVPGSPYAVALDPRGVALAKGTFNSLAQLESVLGTARTRERGLTVAA